jgi:ABC-type transport system involved in multi-copper enzyme maturation permease subunit
MNRLLAQEFRKSLRISNLIILLICTQQIFGRLSMDVVFNSHSNTDYYMLLKIIQNHIFPGVYLCIVLLSCVSMSVEVKEKTYAVQLVSGLSRRQFIIGKALFFYLSGIVVLIFSVVLLLLNFHYASLLEALLFTFKQGIVLNFLLALAIFVFIGLIIGRLLSPILSAGVVILIAFFEVLIRTIFGIFDYQEVIHFLPITFIMDSPNTILGWSIKVIILVIIGMITRYLFIKRDVPL